VEQEFTEHKKKNSAMSVPVSPNVRPTSMVEYEHINLLVLELTDRNKREHALLELSKRREAIPDLAPLLWYSFGVIAALLQEIVSVYPLLSPPKLKTQQSDRVCNALALMQCVASHRNTRNAFLTGMLVLGHLLTFSPHSSFSVSLLKHCHKEQTV
jgi:CCR4-NOT transcription complex subunit 9